MTTISVASSGSLSLTRVTNACVLIELGGHAILTDPWFENPWGFNEDPGIQARNLPRLTAIIGSHFAPDHWGIDALRDYYDRANTPVFTATEGMAKKAIKLGFHTAKRLKWGEKQEVTTDLWIESIPAQQSFGMTTNNYVLSNGETRVFFGGETKALAPLKTYRASNPPVNVALAPSNGMRLLGHQLVTTASEGLEVAKIMGADTFVPIHDSMHNMGFGGPSSSATDLKDRANGTPRIMFLNAGEPAHYTAIGE